MPKKKNEDPQNDKKEIEDLQTFKKTKISPKVHQILFFLKTKITIKTNGRNHIRQNKRED
jgi:hypothetical protein